MAHILADAIHTRLSEIINDGAGLVRTIDAARFRSGLYEGLSPDHESFKGAQISKPTEITIRPAAHSQKLTITGNVQVHHLDVEIRVVRSLPYEARVNDATRRGIKALVTIDADMLTQALEWPPNLRLTTAGAATDLKGLVFDKTRKVVVGVEGKSMVINAIHAFTGTCVSRPATS